MGCSGMNRNQTGDNSYVVLIMTRTSEKARYAFLHEIGICAVTGREGDIHAAHIRGPDSLFGKTESGMGRKPHWVWTIPLSPAMHTLQHTMSEKQFWDSHGYPFRDIAKGPLAAALVLEGFRQLGDVDGARTWLRERASGD